MGVGDTVQKIKKLKRASPSNQVPSGSGLNYRLPDLDTSELKMPHEARAELPSLIGGGGGRGGGGSGGGSGGGDWDSEAEKGGKALELVAKKCLALLAKRLYDAMEKIKDLEEDEKLKASLGTRRNLQSDAVKRDLGQAVAEFKKCLSNSMAGVNAELVDEISKTLLGMAKDEVLTKFGVNMLPIEQVWAAADDAGSAGKNSNRE